MKKGESHEVGESGIKRTLPWSLYAVHYQPRSRTRVAGTSKHDFVTGTDRRHYVKCCRGWGLHSKLWFDSHGILHQAELGRDLDLDFTAGHCHSVEELNLEVYYVCEIYNVARQIAWIVACCSKKLLSRK